MIFHNTYHLFKSSLESFLPVPIFQFYNKGQHILMIQTTESALSKYFWHSKRNSREGCIKMFETMIILYNVIGVLSMSTDMGPSVSSYISYENRSTHS